MPAPCQRQPNLSKNGGKGDTIPSQENLTEDDDRNYRRGDDEAEMRHQKHDAGAAESSRNALRKLYDSTHTLWEGNRPAVTIHVVKYWCGREGRIREGIHQ